MEKKKKVQLEAEKGQFASAVAVCFGLAQHISILRVWHCVDMEQSLETVASGSSARGVAPCLLPWCRTCAIG